MGCQQNGAARLQAGLSSDTTVERVSTALESATIIFDDSQRVCMSVFQSSSSSTSSSSSSSSFSTCLVTSNVVLVGVGSTETLVVLGRVVDDSGLEWTSVTAVVLSSYLTLLHSWSALVYCFAIGMVVAITLAASWTTHFIVNKVAAQSQSELTEVVQVLRKQRSQRPGLASPREETFPLMEDSGDNPLSPVPDLVRSPSPSKHATKLLSLVSRRVSRRNEEEKLAESGKDQSRQPARHVDGTSRAVKVMGLTKLLQEHIGAATTYEAPAINGFDVCMRLLETHFRRVRRHDEDGGYPHVVPHGYAHVINLMGNNVEDMSNTIRGHDQSWFGVDPYSVSEAERRWQWKRVRVFEVARQMLTEAVSPEVT